MGHNWGSYPQAVHRVIPGKNRAFPAQTGQFLAESGPSGARSPIGMPTGTRVFPKKIRQTRAAATSKRPGWLGDGWFPLSIAASPMTRAERDLPCLEQRGRLARAFDDRCTATVMMKAVDLQRTRLDIGKVLPVTSSRSSELRQAATPTHTVSISDVTSRNINENWLTPWPRNRHAILENEHGLPSQKIQSG
jgi:hypothetical protein